MITTRTATLDDAVSIALLMTDLGYPSDTEDVRARLEKILPHNDHKTLCALTADGLIVGMIGMSKNLFYERNGQYVRVLALVVAPNQRNSGIGKKLMLEAENWAKEIKADIILLNCGNRDERKIAQVFYQKMGYVAKSSGFIKKV